MFAYSNRKRRRNRIFLFSSSREHFQKSLEISIDLNRIVLYQCVCGQRFITQKNRNKHARTCTQEQTQAEQVPINEKYSHKKKSKNLLINNNDSIKAEIKTGSFLPELDFNISVSRGRGYIPPALKRAYQSANQTSLYEQARCSSAFDEFNQINKNRPPDAQYFLEDDDIEVAEAFGLEIENQPSKLKILHQTKSNVLCMPASKQNLKIAAYPPKNHSRIFKYEIKIELYASSFLLLFFVFSIPRCEKEILE